ncbi:MAG: hypothetical protein C7B46_19390 [Sulfobacillus benefaciens]|uniref:Uncharacterized protein n=1 Tax=Sulfobacillus benefaciens TaxID=453960 RepID=A0A2T2WZ90_9FIRM|nr:MAG: hypothetical protein C7B46_19390 [Sulfobacillus benefaciens]
MRNKEGRKRGEKWGKEKEHAKGEVATSQTSKKQIVRGIRCINAQETTHRSIADRHDPQRRSESLSLGAPSQAELAGQAPRG